MQSRPLNLGDIRYNPEQGAFEATIRLFDQGEVFAYPVQFRAPLTAGFKPVARGLMRKAQKAHASARPGLRMRRAVQGIRQTIKRGEMPAPDPAPRRLSGPLAA